VFAAIASLCRSIRSTTPISWVLHSTHSAYEIAGSQKELANGLNRRRYRLLGCAINAERDGSLIKGCYGRALALATSPVKKPPVDPYEWGWLTTASEMFPEAPDL
jgi:hypothetical protein